MRFILIKYFEIYVRRIAAFGLCELCSHNIYYKNRTPFSKSKIWTAERTLKYMFAASRRSASLTCVNSVHTTYIIIILISQKFNTFSI